MIGLLDANSFFASCERVFRPDLMKRPVAVLSNNDGNIIARSNEVKALGIPMGAPYYKIKKLLIQHGVAVFSSNFALYGDISLRMMRLIESRVPQMEVYSIDEAFIDFSGIIEVESLARHIRDVIWQSIGIPTSIGIAKTKTLAKVANHFAKRVGGFHSVCVLDSEERTNEALRRLKVSDVWGIGYRISERLQAMGIDTAYQLKQVDPRWMRSHFTVVGERLIQELNGLSCFELEEVADPKKSIQVSRSFGKTITEFDELRETVATYATRLAQKLRTNGLKTRSLVVHINTNRFRPDQPQYSNSITILLPYLVEDDVSLIKAASKGLEKIYKVGFAYHKAGVMALDLLPRDKSVQLDLFSPLPIENPKLIRLSQALDHVNERHGRGTIFAAACGKKLMWRDNKKNISPAYTTCWMSLPKALAI
jgi:DNA polymerase V